MIGRKKATRLPDASEDVRAGESTLRLDCQHATDALLITFAVFPAADGKPRFDFVRATSALNAKRVYVRDPHQLWYQKGTPALGGSVPEVVASLRRIVEDQKAKRLITIGNSGGGFAAILFGVMLGADEIHAFNPPTRLVVPDDTSFPDQLFIIQQEFGPGKPFMDLRVVLGEYLKPATHITIHYSRGDKTDRRHARYLASFPNVRIIQYPVVVHHLARFCNEHGFLAPLLGAVIDQDNIALTQIVQRIKKAGAITYIPSRVFWFFGKTWGRVHRYAHQILATLIGPGSLLDL
jgi:hypothetical protein